MTPRAAGRPDAPPRRIGVAVQVPEPFGAELQRARAAAGDPLARGIPPHITLLGPTDVPAGELGAIAGHLRAMAAEHPPFVIRLRGTGTFRPVSAVVFVQVTQGVAECERLEAAVRRGPLAQDLRFTYHPHVTVAHDVEPAALDRAFTALADFSADFQVQGVHLYEQGGDGTWRTLEVFPLAADPVAAR